MSIMAELSEIFTGPYRVITTIIGAILMGLFLFCMCCCISKCKNQNNSSYDKSNDKSMEFSSSKQIEKNYNNEKNKIAEIGIEPMTFRL